MFFVVRAHQRADRVAGPRRVLHLLKSADDKNKYDIGNLVLPAELRRARLDTSTWVNKARIAIPGVRRCSWWEDESDAKDVLMAEGLEGAQDYLNGLGSSESACLRGAAGRAEETKMEVEEESGDESGEDTSDEAYEARHMEHERSEKDCMLPASFVRKNTLKIKIQSVGGRLRCF